jgi:hypothetical protein
VVDGTRRIEAENYDEGGEGIAYHDLSAENKGGAYRSDGVDIQPTSDDGGYNVGWIGEGEWLEYTIDLSAGTYNVEVRVAAWDPGQQLRVLVDGVELGVLDIPETGWDNWQTAVLSDVTVGSGGRHVLRVEALSGTFNLNWYRFAPVATPTPTPTLTPSEDADFGEQAYGEYGYGGVQG